MGLSLIHPKEFNIDRKKRLQDPLLMWVNGQLLSKSVETWINQDPVRVFFKLYKPEEYSKNYHSFPKAEATLSLCYNAIKLLKQKIQSVRPDLLEDLAQRKLLYTKFRTT
jgi:hypothetical protein